MQNIELKKSQAVQLRPALSAYVRSVYNQDPLPYEDDFRELDELRADAIAIPILPASIPVLIRYYGQLAMLGTRFPIDDDSIKISFPWYNSFVGKEKKPFASFDIRYEQASILFNLAALNWRLGNLERGTSPEGIKHSCKYYLAAAGVFSHISSDFSPTLRLSSSSDLSSAVLEALGKTMQAQAQECFVKKAILEKNLKDGVLAKVALSAGAFYDAASDASREYAALLGQAWLAHLEAKALFYHAIAQYRKSSEALSNLKYGEEIARLQQAETLMKKAKEFQRSLPSEFIVEVESNLVSVQQSLSRALKDNKMIYNEIIPALGALAMIGTAELARPTAIASILNQHANAVGAPLFSRLVPLDIHLSACRYAEKREALIEALGGKLNTAINEQTVLFGELGLPGCVEAAEQPVGLPASVLAKSMELKENGGTQSLYNSASTASHMRAECEKLLFDIAGLLSAEQSDDGEMRRQFGDKWRRTPSSQLTTKLSNQLASFRQKLNMADESDTKIKDLFDQHIADIEALCGSKEDLQNSIPSCTEKNTIVKPAVLGRLKQCIGECEAMLPRRQAILSKIQVLMAADDIVPVLLKAGSQREDEHLFFKQLSQYDVVVGEIDSFLSALSTAHVALRAAYVSFEDCRRTSTALQERETALQNLDMAYQNFKSLTLSYGEALKFYDGLQMALATLAQNTRDFVASRKIEHHDLLMSIQAIATGVEMSRSGLNLSANLPGVRTTALSSIDALATAASYESVGAADARFEAAEAAGPSSPSRFDQGYGDMSQSNASAPPQSSMTTMSNHAAILQPAAPMPLPRRPPPVTSPTIIQPSPAAQIYYDSQSTSPTYYATFAPTAHPFAANSQHQGYPPVQPTYVPSGEMPKPGAWHPSMPIHYGDPSMSPAQRQGHQDGQHEELPAYPQQQQPQQSQPAQHARHY